MEFVRSQSMKRNYKLVITSKAAITRYGLMAMQYTCLYDVVHLGIQFYSTCSNVKLMVVVEDVLLFPHLLRGSSSLALYIFCNKLYLPSHSAIAASFTIDISLHTY